MRHQLRTIAGLVVAFLGVGGTASAQLTNVPIYANPSVSGIHIAGDASFGMNDESGKHEAFAGRVTVTLSKLLLGAGLGYVDFDNADGETTWMGSLGYRLVGSGGSLLNVSLQAGAGFVSTDSLVNQLKRTDIPIALGIGLHLPIPVIGIEPWIAPRYTFRWLSQGGESSNRNHFGFSVGADVTLPLGIGAQIAGDWSSLPELSSGGGDIIDDLKRKPYLLSAGLHFRF
jgi:hypothetical protein